MSRQTQQSLHFAKAISNFPVTPWDCFTVQTSSLKKMQVALQPIGILLFQEDPGLHFAEANIPVE